MGRGVWGVGICVLGGFLLLVLNITPWCFNRVSFPSNLTKICWPVWGWGFLDLQIFLDFRVSIFGIFRGVWGPGLLFLLGLGMGACCNFLLRGVLGCPRVLNFLLWGVSFWGGRGFLEVGVISPNFWGVLLLALATTV